MLLLHAARSGPRPTHQECRVYGGLQGWGCRYQTHQRLTPLDLSKSFVYQEKDFAEIINELTELLSLTVSFALMLVMEDRPSGVQYEMLCNALRSELEKARKRKVTKGQQKRANLGLTRVSKGFALSAMPYNVDTLIDLFQTNHGTPGTTSPCHCERSGVARLSDPEEQRASRRRAKGNRAGSGHPPVRARPGSVKPSLLGYDMLGAVVKWGFMASDADADRRSILAPSSRRQEAITMDQAFTSGLARRSLLTGLAAASAIRRPSPPMPPRLTHPTPSAAMPRCIG